MEKYLLSLLVFFASASHATGYDFLISCDGCSFDDEKWAAQATPTGSNGNWSVYVIDGVAETLTAFNVNKYSQYIDNWGLVEYSSAAEIPVDPLVQADFNTAVGFAQSVKADLDSDAIPIPPSIAGSAYEVLFNPGLQAQISDHIAYNMTSWQSLGFATNAALIFLFQLTESTVSTQVVFSDGSTMRFKVTGVTSTNLAIFTFEYIEDSAVGPDGNPIPDSTADAQAFIGQFDSVVSAQAMVEFLEEFFTSSFGTTWRCRQAAGEEPWEIIVRCGTG